MSNSNKPVWGTCPVVQDFDGPNITNILVTPTFVDITNSATKVITVSYRATDTSGIDSITIIDHQLLLQTQLFTELILVLQVAPTLMVPTQLP